MINIDSRIISTIDANELFLLVNLANRMNQDKTCFPSNKTICNDLKWSKEKLQQVKKRLVEKGILKIDFRHKDSGPGQTSNLYRILTPQVGNYTPGLEIGMGEVGKSVSPPVGNPDTAPVGKSGMSQGGKPGNEVLTNEVLTNEELTIEELKKERENNSLLLSHYDILKELILFIYPHLENVDYNIFEENDHIKDPNTQNLLKKIRRVAENLHSAFNELKQPIPAWRNWQSTYNGIEAGKPNARQDAIDQLQSYAEFCRVTKTYMTTDPEKLTEKILMADWCVKLKEYADERFPGQYDPMADFDGSPDWIMWYFYEQQMFYVDKRNHNRMF